MQAATSSDEHRQRLGRRLGLEPYYTLSANDGAQLRLDSRPEANRGPGRTILAGGALLLLLAALVALSGLYAAAMGIGFTAGALGAVIGGLLGALGYQRILGGYAVLTTHNSIVADAGEAALSFTQGNRLAPERTQRLPFTQITVLRLRRRPLVVGALFRRVRPIVALELLTRDNSVWVVDSAEDAEQLRAAAEGLSELLGMELTK